MTPEIIETILAFLERIQLSWREVPTFNRVVWNLISEREKLLSENKVEKA